MTRFPNSDLRRPAKRALLVGINQYPKSPLRGCVNDALMMGNLLIDHFGFTPGADMRLLVDQRATKRGILDRLEWLIDGARPGDILVFHYSGHGAQVPDRSGDELDEVDECLVPIDHDWDDPLLDEDLGRIVRNVAEGVNLTIVLDCCHSGTGTKEYGPPVPSDVKRLLPPPDIQFRMANEITVDDGFPGRSVTMTSFRHMKLNEFGRSAEQQNAIVITGCRDDQLSHDAYIHGDFHGALTYALYETLEHGGSSQTYAQWHRDAAARIPGYNIRNQDPQLECHGDLANWQLFSTQSAGGVTVGTRAERARTHVVYVHGICEHPPGYSVPWWRSMKPYVPQIPDENRHEVLWSDIVSKVTRGGELTRAESKEKQNIVDVLKDRAIRSGLEAAAGSGEREFTPDAGGSRAVLGIPGVDCIDDFMKYLLDDDIRRDVIQRFMDVVCPLINRGNRVEVISHSWGTVVAYEALLMMAEEDDVPDGVVHNLFSVGSALSIRPVQRLLIPQADGGPRPRIVDNWVNLDAKNDIVGGPLKGVPFAVDFEYLNLKAVGCWPPFFNWACAHSSYFEADNKVVQRDIFARHINDGA